MGEAEIINRYQYLLPVLKEQMDVKGHYALQDYQEYDVYRLHQGALLLRD